MLEELQALSNKGKEKDNNKVIMKPLGLWCRETK